MAHCESSDSGAEEAANHMATARRGSKGSDRREWKKRNVSTALTLPGDGRAADTADEALDERESVNNEKKKSGGWERGGNGMNLDSLGGFEVLLSTVTSLREQKKTKQNHEKFPNMK